MLFNYYYGAEADQFNFIRVPKAMMKDAAFASLSLASRLLYGLLLDRMSLSMKNKWFDDENRVYIIYQITEIMDDLGVSKKKAIEYLQELEKFGLVEKKRRGLGLPSILYVKSFIEKEPINNNTLIGQDNNMSGMSENDTNVDSYYQGKDESMKPNNIIFRGVQSGTSRSSHSDTSRSGALVTSRSVDREHHEVPVGSPQNNTKENYNNINNTNSNLIYNQNAYSLCDGMDEINIYAEYLTERLEIELLCERYPQEKDTIMGMYDLILEILLCKNDTIHIAGNEFPTQVVKGRFMKIDSGHIEYVLSCLKTNTTKVVNIKKYLLASLFNAPTTMPSYYQAEFNHDMPQYVT